MGRRAAVEVGGLLPAGPAGRAAPSFPAHEEAQLLLGGVHQLPRLLEGQAVGGVVVDLEQHVALLERVARSGAGEAILVAVQDFPDVDFAAEHDAEVCSKTDKKMYRVHDGSYSLAVGP